MFGCMSLLIYSDRLTVTSNVLCINHIFKAGYDIEPCVFSLWGVSLLCSFVLEITGKLFKPVDGAVGAAFITFISIHTRF